ncbi:MAG: type II toxin-antitoxin system VapC family toxin [Dermatophilaceae bacterium]|nr:type II toxin-antitoxin system VapC family toxin [Dermatophilaceae bacterium]MBP9919041.1 type II toxin-antitoxin system VapC family toxin [Dermatophilaceae bacterium]
MTLVVDTSALVAIVFGEPDAEVLLGVRGTADTAALASPLAGRLGQPR